jgi:hypothetical protein
MSSLDLAKTMLILFSVAEFLPGFQDRVRDSLKVLLGEEGTARVRMGLAKDGSGVGGKFLHHLPSPSFCHFPSLPSASRTQRLTNSRTYRATSQKGIG